MKFTSVVIIDSIIDKKHECFKSVDIEVLKIDGLGGAVHGHGTAIGEIISRQASNLKITNIGIFNETLSTDYESLIKALTYVRDYLDCNIVNLSLGMPFDDERLYCICKELADRGIIIVSAYDNCGAVSYPAVYPFVIGVDTSLRCIKPEDFVYVANSMINLRAKGGKQRVAWDNSSYAIVQGSSFAAAYVSAYVVKLMNKGVTQYEKILKEFEKIARFKYQFDSIEEKKKFSIKEYSNKSFAIVPYNKEIHSLLNFKDKLNFEIKDIYDIRHSGNVGKTVRSIDETVEYTIKNIERCDYSQIDVMIIGHMKEMDLYSGRNNKKNILNECYKNNVNVFSFDNYELQEVISDFSNKNLCCYYPAISRPIQKFGKLYKIKLPVLGVFGTSKQQGKFTLQLQIRYELIKRGYKVAEIGTEPSAELFGMSEVFPYGYDSEFNMANEECISSLNELMHELDNEENDLILVGAQSGTVPLLYENIGQIPAVQYAFIAGTMPDGVILCCNVSDDIDYINRTIKFIEGVSDSKVFLLAIYPMLYEELAEEKVSSKRRATEEEIESFKEMIQDNLNLKCVEIGNIEQMDTLIQSIVNFFS